MRTIVSGSPHGDIPIFGRVSSGFVLKIKAAAAPEAVDSFFVFD